MHPSCQGGEGALLTADVSDPMQKTTKERNTFQQRRPSHAQPQQN